MPNTARPTALVRPEQRPDLCELLFSSSGRLSRLAFASGEALVLALLWLYDRWAAGWPRRLTGWAVLCGLLSAGCCLVSRRLHDLGRAGWWTALPFALFQWAWPHPASGAGAALAVMAVLLCALPGAPRPNRFGPALATRR